MAYAAGHDRFQMNGDRSPVDDNDTLIGLAMPFTLLKLAYNACVREVRDLYNTRIYGLPVDLQDCCKYLMATGDRSCALQSNDGERLAVCSTAAFNGHLDCLQLAHVAGIPWNWRTTTMACQAGHIECLKYAHKNGCETGGFVAVLAAARAEHVNILEYAWFHNFSFPPNMFSFIVPFGSIETMRYLRSLGFRWDATTTAEAARCNQLSLLKYLREHDCPWDSTTCLAAATNGNIECLEYAHTNGCPWHEHTIQMAAHYGHINCLEYAHTNGCDWDEHTCYWAAHGGHIDCLKYAHTNGCSWNEDTCKIAASNGHIECLKYAHTNGCSWDENTCLMAATNGHIECLKYAHTNGCEWTTLTPMMAASNKHEECFRYAIENGCPWPSWITWEIFLSNNDD